MTIRKKWQLYNIGSGTSMSLYNLWNRKDFKVNYVDTWYWIKDITTYRISLDEAGSAYPAVFWIWWITVPAWTYVYAIYDDILNTWSLNFINPTLWWSTSCPYTMSSNDYHVLTFYYRSGNYYYISSDMDNPTLINSSFNVNCYASHSIVNLTFNTNSIYQAYYTTDSSHSNPISTIRAIDGNINWNISEDSLSSFYVYVLDPSQGYPTTTSKYLTFYPTCYGWDAINWISFTDATTWTKTVVNKDNSRLNINTSWSIDVATVNYWLYCYYWFDWTNSKQTPNLWYEWWLNNNTAFKNYLTSFAANYWCPSVSSFYDYYQWIFSVEGLDWSWQVDVSALYYQWFINRYDSNMKYLFFVVDVAEMNWIAFNYTPYWDKTYINKNT